MKKSKGDAYGYERGARGVDREDNSEWFRNFDPKADAKMYGPDYVGKYNVVLEDGLPTNAAKAWRRGEKLADDLLAVLEGDDIT